MKNIVKMILVLMLCVTEVQAKETKSAVEFLAFGDTPYGEQGEKQLPKLIEKMNQTDADFAVHIGDIKNGRTVCSDEHFLKVYNWFQSLQLPLIYTPGDNEWTDCHRKNNGSYEPLERLSALRKLFFKTPNQSLGQKPIKLVTQSAQGYVENSLWENNGVVFVTVHMVGSYNNIDRNSQTTQEYIKRNAANIQWLNKAFERASHPLNQKEQSQSVRAVVVLTQANPWMQTSNGDYSVVGGFNEFMTTLAALTKEFKKPVLFVHGDTHMYRYNKKTVSPDFQKLDNFYRLEVPGDGDTEAVLVHVESANKTPFHFKKIKP